MNRKEVINNVVDYIKDEKANYAIMINAPWGAGKTYLYDKYLVNEIADKECGKNVRKTNVYISLYGLSDIESLAKELFTNYILRVKHINKYAYKITDGVVSIISKFISVSAGPIAIRFGGLTDFLKRQINIKDMVICFDDLERCSLNYS